MEVYKFRWWIVFISTEAIAAGVLGWIGLLSPWMLIVVGATTLISLFAWDNSENYFGATLGLRLKWSIPTISFIAVIGIGLAFASQKPIDAPRSSERKIATTIDKKEAKTESKSLFCYPFCSGPEWFSPPEEVRRNSDGSARIYVNEPIGRLMKRFKPFTALQAEEASKTFVGKWTALGGTVAEVKPLFGAINVRLEEGTNPPIMPDFDASQSEQLKMLNPGDHIKAVCRISLIDSTRALLEHCQLVSSGQ